MSAADAALAVDLATARERASPEERAARAKALLSKRMPCGAALVALVGRDAAAQVLRVTPGVVETLATGTPGQRRRLHALLCQRFGLAESEALAVAATLPPEPVHVARAAFHFALTVALAGAPRVLSREAYARLVREFGADAAGFALGLRRHVRHDVHDGAPDLVGVDADALAARAPDLLVETLRRHGHPTAGPVAAILGRSLSREPVEPSRLDEGRLAVAVAALTRARAHALGAIGPDARDDTTPDASGATDV